MSLGPIAALIALLFVIGIVALIINAISKSNAFFTHKKRGH